MLFLIILRWIYLISNLIDSISLSKQMATRFFQGKKEEKKSFEVAKQNLLHLPGNKEKVAETHSEKDSYICKEYTWSTIFINTCLSQQRNENRAQSYPSMSDLDNKRAHQQKCWSTTTAILLTGYEAKKKKRKTEGTKQKYKLKNWLTKSLFHCLIFLAFWLRNLDFDLG